MTYRVLVTPISDRVLPALFWSGPRALAALLINAADHHERREREAKP